MLFSVSIFLLISPALIEGGLIGTVVGEGVIPLASTCVKAKLQTDIWALTLPIKLASESYNTYIRRVFVKEDETTEDYYARIFKQYEKESNEDYIRRIDFIFSEFPQLESKHNPDYLPVSENYYKLKYGSIESIYPDEHEHEEEYFSRILKKEEEEDFNTYIRRMDIIYQVYPRLVIWRKIQFDKDSEDFYYYRDMEYNSNIKPSLNIREKIVEMYARRESEEDDDYTYFKRICEHRVGETNKDYVERLTKIKERYGNLPLWYSTDYIGLIKEYYTQLYGKKDNEDLGVYYKRITQKPNTEDLTTYVKRIKILENLFGRLPLWNNEDFLELTQTYYKEIYAKQPNEDDIKYLQRVTLKSSSEEVAKYAKRMNIVRWVCKDTNLFYDTKYLKYTKTYFEIFYKKCSESDESWFERIFRRNYKETDDEYVKRINMLRMVQSSLTSFNVPERCLKYASDFYKLVYRQRPSESTDAWLKRITVKEESEPEETYKYRLHHLGSIYSNCKNAVTDILKRGSNIITEKSSSKQGSADTQVQARDLSEKTDGGYKKTLTEEEIAKHFAKKEEEDITTYYKRITKKETSTEDYIKTLTSVRKIYPNLPLWYNIKYIDLLKDYYTLIFNKKSTETEEEQFKRIISKETFETDEQCAQRVGVVHELFPNLGLWSDEKYYEKFTKLIYRTVYKKSTTEDESTYFKRICSKSNKESDVTYVGRLNLIRKSLNTLPLWYSEKYFDTVKQFYRLKYAKQSDESDDEYLTRLVEKDTSDASTDNYVQRTHLVHLSTIDSKLWYDKKYYEKYTKSYYESFYKKTDKESNESWLAKVITKLPGESNELSIKRIQLIKKSIAPSGCWTLETLSKVESTKTFQSEYIIEIKNIVVGDKEYMSQSSGSSSLSKAVSASEEETVIKQGS